MDSQTLFKDAGQYYILQKEKLLKEGYKLVEDTKEKSVFEKENKNEHTQNT
jgi:hypothetical protein